MCSSIFPSSSPPPPPPFSLWTVPCILLCSMSLLTWIMSHIFFCQCLLLPACVFLCLCFHHLCHSLSLCLSISPSVSATLSLFLPLSLSLALSLSHVSVCLSLPFCFLLNSPPPPSPFPLYFSLNSCTDCLRDKFGLLPTAAFYLKTS